MTASLRPIHDGWTVEPVGGPGVDHQGLTAIPAGVPGTVHTDLLAAGVIPDPYLDRNELLLQWVGLTDWQYRTSFDWRPDGQDRIELVCKGLDTVASLTLNGVELGATRNMHRGYRFDVTGVVVEGANELVVRFDSAYNYAIAERERLGDRPTPYPDAPFAFIRKMASNFGWDWGPIVITCGIWRPIGLQSWTSARFANVRPQVTVHTGRLNGEAGQVDLDVELARSDDEPVTVSATVGGVRVEATTNSDRARLSLTVDDVRRWYPRGYGEAFRYDLEVTLSRADGSVLDTWSRRIGFRSVVLDTTPDEVGSPYRLVVNDQAVWIKGVNWITDDCFPSRINRARLADRLTQCVEANVNYVRVWGGGIYESEDFYDLADEYGLMVGQDFLFACAAYPEDEPLFSEVRAEAEDNVTRLSTHPSLVTWTGNNENIWGHQDWDWIPALGDKTWGAGFYYQVLPDVLARLDPTRPYWPGSPYSGRPDLDPNDPSHGSMHIWDVWNKIDYAHYRDYVPRLAAEFGYQAPPTYATLAASIHDEPLAPDSPGMALHQKAEDGDAKLRRGLQAHLPEPQDFDDWHYLTQLNQARAITLAVAHFRAHQPTCMGSIVWQINDCWPVTSWAAIDGYGRRKPLWHALRAVYADHLLTIQPDPSGGLAIVLVNNGADDWAADVSISRCGLDGVVLASIELKLQAMANTSAWTLLPPEIATAGDAPSELIRAVADGRTADWFFVEDRDVRYPPAAWTSSARGDELTITAETIVRDLVLYADRIEPDAWAEPAMVTLLPGESVTFTLHGLTAVDLDRATTRPILRAVNDLT